MTRTSCTVKYVSDEVSFLGVGRVDGPAVSSLGERLVRHDRSGVVLDSARLGSTHVQVYDDGTYPSIHEYPTPSENCSFWRQRIELGK